MKKKRRRLEDVRLIGLKIHPGSFYGIYRKRWSDGTETVENGHPINGGDFNVGRTLRGSLEERTRRPELGYIVRAIKDIVELLEDAAQWADNWQPPQKKRKPCRRKRPPKKQVTRIAEV